MNKKSASIQVSLRLSGYRGAYLRLCHEERAFKKNNNWTNEIQSEIYAKKSLIRNFICFLKDLQDNTDLNQQIG